MESEVWRKVISNKIIVTLGTQGLPSSFLSCSCCVTSRLFSDDAIPYGLLERSGSRSELFSFIFKNLKYGLAFYNKKKHRWKDSRKWWWEVGCNQIGDFTWSTVGTLFVLLRYTNQHDWCILYSSGHTLQCRASHLINVHPNLVALLLKLSFQMNHGFLDVPLITDHHMFGV